MLLKSEFLIKQTSMEYVVGRIIGDKEVHQRFPQDFTPTWGLQRVCDRFGLHFCAIALFK